MKKIILFIAILLTTISYAQTRSIVPRSDGEGSIGTLLKAWGKGYLDTLTINDKVTLPSNTTIGNISSTEINALDAIQSNIQGQLNGKLVQVNGELTLGENGQAAETGKLTLRDGINSSNTIYGGNQDGEIYVTINAGLDSGDVNRLLDERDLANFNTSVLSGAGTTNQLSFWSNSNTLGTLSTSTYPTLTELSRVKGVTSAIQTQFTGKVDKANSIIDSTITFTTFSTGMLPIDNVLITNRGGELLVQDDNSNQTIISPHPKAFNGRWMYLSEKDGVYTAVDWENFIIAVEKITGKKFLYKGSLEQIKKEMQ